jgi:hypothetical protein
MNWIYRTLSDAPLTLDGKFRRARNGIKDVRSAHAGFAGASHP